MPFPCFRLFDKEKDYKEPLGGPRSFYKFIYKNSQLILMGEAHKKMPGVLVTKYADVFNQFIEKNDHIKLFLEKRNDENTHFTIEIRRNLKKNI